MKKSLLITILLMWVSQASAHTGSHAETSFSTMVQHFASSPYHIGVVIVTSLLVISMLFKRDKKEDQTNC